MTNCNGFCAYMAYKMAILCAVRVILIPIEWYDKRYNTYNKYPYNNNQSQIKETFVDRCHRERIAHQKAENEKNRQIKQKQKQQSYSNNINIKEE